MAHKALPVRGIRSEGTVKWSAVDDPTCGVRHATITANNDMDEADVVMLCIAKIYCLTSPRVPPPVTVEHRSFVREEPHTVLVDAR